MIRGKFVIIYDDGSGSSKVYVKESIEFNGGMYPEGSASGRRAIESLIKLQDAKDFESMVSDFNASKFQYDDVKDYTFDVTDRNKNADIEFIHYAELWRSDYLYIKNLSFRNCIIRSRSNLHYSIEKDEVQVYCFGEKDEQGCKIVNDVIKCASENNASVVELKPIAK